MHRNGTKRAGFRCWIKSVAVLAFAFWSHMSNIFPICDGKHGFKLRSDYASFSPPLQSSQINHLLIDSPSQQAVFERLGNQFGENFSAGRAQRAMLDQIKSSTNYCSRLPSSSENLLKLSCVISGQTTERAERSELTQLSHRVGGVGRCTSAEKSFVRSR